MQTIILNASPHKSGNLSRFANIVADELAGQAHSVETVSLYDLRLGPCCSCDACATTGRCVFADDFTGLSARLLAADLIIFATPVYWFSVSGVMKIFMDRTQSLWHGRRLRGKAGAALVAQAHAGATETCALLASFCHYHGMSWLGCSAVTTRDRRDLVAGSAELQGQAREFAQGLAAALAK